MATELFRSYYGLCCSLDSLSESGSRAVADVLSDSKKVPYTSSKLALTCSNCHRATQKLTWPVLQPSKMRCLVYISYMIMLKECASAALVSFPSCSSSAGW